MLIWRCGWLVALKKVPKPLRLFANSNTKQLEIQGNWRRGCGCLASIKESARTTEAGRRGEASGRLKPRKTEICTVCRNIDFSRGVTSAQPHSILCHVSCTRVAWQDIDTISKQLQGKSKNTSLQKYRYQQAKLSRLYSTLCQPCAARVAKTCRPCRPVGAIFSGRC